MTFMDGIDLYIDSLFEQESREEININTVFDHFRKINSDISEFFGKYKISEIDTVFDEKNHFLNLDKL